MSWFQKVSPGHGAAGENHGVELQIPAGEPGPVWRLKPSVPVGLEIDFDLDEERDLDRHLQAELALAEEVTDHPGEDAKAAAVADRGEDRCGRKSWR